ncbi:GNAT family N-acetyltransferase [Kribbella sp. CA-293567]|uniref:GNAT family N-acetyltransferase n=1 Tax=Kribbella sp. CA-293567 TaxID=3002436 RepID=UPI0022DE2C55|nr:GNAT family N-acetyltransferase [Kribbella sp. CA-293567]WBQ02864.1 GNAT family N-acetyltransferase [Kribbella sp. CA-293567]
MNALDLSKITLRPLQPGDWTRIHEWASLAESCRYQPWGPNTEAETRAFVTTAIASASADPRTRYAWVATHPLTGVLGTGELNIRHATWKRGEISYAVHPDFWGQGVASEIARILLEFGFGHLQLERIEATCDPRNSASAAVLKRIGMTHEGILRRTVLIRTGWRDSKLHSLIRPEWTPTTTPPRWTLT